MNNQIKKSPKEELIELMEQILDIKNKVDKLLESVEYAVDNASEQQN